MLGNCDQSGVANSRHVREKSTENWLRCSGLRLIQSESELPSEWKSIAKNGEVNAGAPGLQRARKRNRPQVARVKKDDRQS